VSERRSWQRRNNLWKPYQETLSDGVCRLSVHRVEGAKQDTPQPSWKTLFKGEYQTSMRCVHFLIPEPQTKVFSVLRYSNSRSNSTAHWMYKTRVYPLRWGTREAVPSDARGNLSEVTYHCECRRNRRESETARRAHKYGIVSRHL
jgi:hypothetical protein